MTHAYLSTACLHAQQGRKELHEHCKAKANLEGEPKAPGVCKWCSAPCVCDCHGHMLVSSAAFVVPETSGGTYDPDLQEARIHQVLGEDELHD